jgi:hypothetical protein
MTVAEVIDRWGLQEMVERKWSVQEISIRESDQGGITGLDKVQEWLYSNVGPKNN